METWPSYDDLPRHHATGEPISWTTFGGMTQPPASQIANPDPISPLKDKYKVDKGWTNCGDITQPGVKPVRDYLGSLLYHPSPNCENHFYMVNNISPGFKPNGVIDTAAITAGTKVPPSALRYGTFIWESWAITAPPSRSDRFVNSTL